MLGTFLGASRGVHKKQRPPQMHSSRLQLTIPVPNYIPLDVLQSACDAFNRVYNPSRLMDSNMSSIVQAACVVLACKNRMCRYEYSPMAIFRHCARSQHLSTGDLLDAELFCLKRMEYHMV